MTTRPVTVRRGAVWLKGVDVGAGPPVLFQHGLAGDVTQAAETFPDGRGWRRLTLDSRGHGLSPPGPDRPFSIPLFAADALAFAEQRGAPAFVAGGISMGAAMALHLGVRHPDRVRALVLVRPGWAFAPEPPYLQHVAAIGALLRRMPPAEARGAFLSTPGGRQLGAEAPANLKALLGWFDWPDAAAAADLCTDIARGDPGATAAEAAGVRRPTLVLGHADDAAHPLATAQALAAGIPGARFTEVPARTAGKAAHLAATRDAIAQFLRELG